MKTARQDIYTAMAAICDAPDVEQRWTRLTSILATFGIDQINYGVFDSLAADRLSASVRYQSTMREDWIDYYGDRRMDLDDPHVALVRNGNLSTYRWGEDQLKSIDEQAARSVILQAAEAGLRSQLQVTLPDSDGSLRPIAGMALGSSLGESEYMRVIAGHEASLVTLAHLFHNCSLGEMKRLNEGVSPLSQRERDCLRYLAQGLRIDAIADRIGLARVTVEMHLRRARQRLGAATLPEAVAKALRYQEIRLD